MTTTEKTRQPVLRACAHCSGRFDASLDARVVAGADVSGPVLPDVSDGGRDMTRMFARGANFDEWGREGEGPFCQEQWDRGRGRRFLVCQRGPGHLAEGRPHKAPGGLTWTNEERAEGRLR